MIVLLFIGGGIVLFILSEMTSGANGPIGPVEQRMGQIGQLEIDRNEFERTLSGAFSGGDAYQNRDALWQFYIDEGILAQEAQDMGLTVTREELRDLEFGPNPSPIIRRNMTDPQTGQLNRTLLTNIQGHIENGTLDDAIRDGELNPDIRTIWKYQRRNIITGRLQEKVNALVGKAMYAPSWQAQEFADAQLAGRQVAITKIPFAELNPDSSAVTDTDIQAYIDENRSLFNNPEETRTLSYVTFDVKPADTDLAALRETLTGLKAEWARESNAAGDSLFAVANGGSYTGNYQPRAQFSTEVADRVLGDMENGTVYGPYQEGTEMKLVKLLDQVTMSDSAKTRHILINAGTPDEFEEADQRVDSLMNVMDRRRRNFGALAAEFSDDDGSKDNGGVYEKVTPGQFVRPFDEVLFRTGEVGELYKIRTSYGVHLVEIMERSTSTSPRAKVAYVAEPIVPSSDTEDTRLQEAQQFLNGKSSLADLKAAGMDLTTTPPVSINTYNLTGLGSGQEVRDIMCWAFSADADDVSSRVYRFTDPQLFYENKYVVVGVETIIPAGLAPVAAVKESLLPQVSNRVAGVRAKAELTGKSAAAAATQYGVSVDTVNSNISLSSLPRVGAEPKVIAAATGASVGQPVTVVGNSGVYVIEALGDPSTGTSGSLPAARSQINSRVRNQAASSLLPALRAGAEVEDERMALECR